MHEKKLFYILFAFLLLTFSCKKQPKDPYADYPELILGEWVMLGDNTYHLNEEGFNFISNDSCEIRPGYQDILYPSPLKYYGNTTAYFISNDTLHLYDLREKRWLECKIRFQSPDTINIKFGIYAYNDPFITYVSCTLSH